MSAFSFQKVLIVVPWYSEHDAICNDAYWQQQFLLNLGITAYLYAEGCSLPNRDRLISWTECEQLMNDPRNLLIYHHGVYWIQGEQIFNRAQAKICLKYHNITPPEFYRGYDRISTYATEMGREQTARFLKSQKIWLCLGDSHYNLDDLRSYECPMPRTEVIAPFTQISDFDKVEADPLIREKLGGDDKLHLLFVGRVVPNKGHAHLLKVLERYVSFYGSAVHLNVIGSLALEEETYFIELENLIHTLGLGRHVTFHQKVGFAGIKAFYQHSDVFLLMSEHEGFCVPILESQYMGLPLVALDRTAVKETLGKNQLITDSLDYDFFACAIHHVATNKDLNKQLREQGFVNYERFRPKELMQQTIDILTLN